MMIARAAASAVLLLAVAAPAEAQVTDTTRAADTSSADSFRRPPVSAKRAFLGSLILPGLSQSRLGRYRSGALMIGFEAASIIMIRDAALGVREARRLSADSVQTAYVDGSGAPTARFERTRFPSGLARARQTQVEDWIAVMVFNHLFSAADALVASLLWDLPAEVAVRGSRRNAGVGLAFRF